jgi:hypothetical protein
VTGNWTPVVFESYYLFGGILTAPWLALGTLLLLARRPVALGYLAVLTLFTVCAAVLLFAAHVTAADVAHDVPEGRDFLPVVVRVMAVLGNIAGTVIVVGGALVSGLALRHNQRLRSRFQGNLLIAAGVLLAASGGGFAFLGRSGGLAAALALGAAVMYAGFRRASAPIAAAPAPAGAVPPTAEAAG